MIDSEDGKALVLASGVPGAKKKRWKVGCLNKTVAREMEAAIKTNLLLGKVSSEQAKPVLFKEWAKTYLAMESVSTLRSYQDRVEIMERQLIPYFGRKILTEIKPSDVEAFRAQRLKRDGTKASTQTVNNDHIVLKHALNVAIRRGLLASNPAARVPMPNPNNERDRVLSEEERGKLYQAAKPHLKPVLLLAYQLGQRLSEDSQSDLGPRRPQARVCHSPKPRHQDEEAEASPHDARCETDLAANCKGSKPRYPPCLLVPEATTARLPNGLQNGYE